VKLVAALEQLKTPRAAPEEKQAAEPKAAETKAELAEAADPKVDEPKVEEAKADGKTKLTDDQLENVRKTFKACDLDGSGFIEANELKVVMKVLGAEITDDDCAVIFKSLDVNGDQKIDFDEYLKLIDQALKGTLS